MIQTYTFKPINRLLWITFAFLLFWVEALTVITLIQTPQKWVQIPLWFSSVLIGIAFIVVILLAIHTFDQIEIKDNTLIIKRWKKTNIPYSHILDVDQKSFFMIIYSSEGTFLVSHQIQNSKHLFSVLSSEVNYPRRIPYDMTRYWRALFIGLFTGIFYILYYGRNTYSIYLDDPVRAYRIIPVFLILLLIPISFIYYEFLIVPHYLLIGKDHIIKKSIWREKIYTGLVHMKSERRWINYTGWRSKRKTLVLTFADGKELLLPENDIKWNLLYIVDSLEHYYDVVLPKEHKNFLSNPPIA